MKIKHLLLFIFFLLQFQISSGQDSDNYTWWNPTYNEFYVVEGQGWPGKVESTYDRLPKEIKKKLENLFGIYQNNQPDY